MASENYIKSIALEDFGSNSIADAAREYGWDHVLLIADNCVPGNRGKRLYEYGDELFAIETNGDPIWREDQRTWGDLDSWEAVLEFCGLDAGGYGSGDE